MRIKTWKAWHCRNQNPSNTFSVKLRWTPHPVRIVPEATWRKVMAVVKVMEAIQKSSDPLSIQEWGRIDGSIDGLREHERKRK